MSLKLTVVSAIFGKTIGLVVQLVRIPACHAGGREFESRPDRIVANPSQVLRGVFRL